MKISSNQIREFLKDHNIAFQWDDYFVEEYTIASFFKPTDAGFYFYNGKEELPIKTKNSLIFVPKNFENKRRTNAYIHLEMNPQEAYYRLLNNLHGSKSTGIVSKTAAISPNARIGKNVQIDDFCVLEDCIIGENVIIRSHSKIHSNTKIGKNTTIESGSIIGAQGVAWVWNEGQSAKIVQPQLGGVEIGENCFLGANTIVVRGSLNENTQIGKKSLLASGARIGHGTQIGEAVHFANNVITGGNSIIGRYSFIGSGAIFRPKVKIHEKTIVGAGAVVVKNTTKERLTLMGTPAKETRTKENPQGMPIPKK